MFARLAEVLKVSLETVWRMTDVERGQLIALHLGVGVDDDPSQDIHVDNGQSADGDVPQTENNNSEDEFKSRELAETDERTNEIYRSLQTDTEEVKRLLKGSRNENADGAEIFAYLEAHQKNPDRVQVVVDELSGVEFETDSGQKLLPVEISVKGKGKGKSSLGSSERGTKRLLSAEDKESSAEYKRYLQRRETLGQDEERETLTALRDDTVPAIVPAPGCSSECQDTSSGG